MSDYSQDMRQQEAESQAKIQQGLNFINRIYGGGTTGTGQAWTYNPNQTYYNSLGQQLTKNLADPAYLKFLYDQGYVNNFGQPTNTTNVGSAGNKFNNRTRVTPTTPGSPVTIDQWDRYMQGLATGGNLFTGTASHEGFNDAFYNGVQQDYMDTTSPQLTQQYRDMVRNVEASLARRGILSGSAHQRYLNADETQGDLGTLVQEHTRQTGDLQNQAANYANQVRGQVNDNKNTAISQLLQSQNPTLAAQTALAGASQARTMPVIAPLGQAFGDWANTFFYNSLGQDIRRNQSVQPQTGYNFATTKVGGISN